MRNVRFGLVVAIVLLAVASISAADVLCVAPSGLVRQRVECKPRETPLDLSGFGLQGPPGPPGPPGSCDAGEPISFSFYVASCVGCSSGDFSEGNPVFVVPQGKVLVVTDIINVRVGSSLSGPAGEFRFVGSAGGEDLYVLQAPETGLNRTFASGLRLDPGPVVAAGPNAVGVSTYAFGILSGRLLSVP